MESRQQIMNLNMDHEYWDLIAGLGQFEAACPYLPDRTARYAYLDGLRVGSHYGFLMDQGYRRSGRLIYRMECEGCAECQIIRIRVAEFVRSRSQDRVWKKGQSLFRYSLEEPQCTPEKIDLYERYLNEQHDRAGYVSLDDYESFLVHSCLDSTRELQIHDGERLIGLGIVDFFGDRMSSVYFIFDPDYGKYSPGTYSFLLELHLAQTMGLTYHYAGFYIAGCPQMNYKKNFGPHQIKKANDSWG
ncbi:MAG: arginyltransferase [Spirochaetales bacterium]|nr:arginyltransferase [Spirochaetales bacterium]